MNFFVVFITLENTNNQTGLFPDVSICNLFPEMFQTSAQLLTQKINFGTFSSDI